MMSANEDEMPPVGFITAAEYRDAVEESYYTDNRKVWADKLRAYQQAEQFADGLWALTRAFVSVVKAVGGDD